MRTVNEPKIKKEVVCDLCGTLLMDIQLQELDWSEARMYFNEPFVTCPICKNKIYNVLAEESKDDNKRTT